MIETLVTYLPIGLSVGIFLLFLWYIGVLWAETRAFSNAAHAATSALSTLLKTTPKEGLSKVQSNEFHDVAEKTGGIAGEWLGRINRDLEPATFQVICTARHLRRDAKAEAVRTFCQRFANENRERSLVKGTLSPARRQSQMEGL